MTTATIDFDQPTLFKEGRFTRDSPPSPARPEPPATPAPSDRAGAASPSDRAAAPPAPPSDRAAAAHPGTRPHGHVPRDRLTLDDVLSDAWDGLAAHHSVTCPVCSGSMAPRYGSGAAPVGGRCKRCGSTLG
jgi:hypothetical protein